MKNIVWVLFVLCTFSFANSDFATIVDELVKEDLEKIEKPKQINQIIKDEFETTQEFEKRIQTTKEKFRNDVLTYKAKVKAETPKAKKRAVTKALKYIWGIPKLSEPTYDADNGHFISKVTFTRKKDFDKKVAIKVDRKNARDFKKNFNNLKPKAVFDYKDNSISLKEIKIDYNNNKYIAQFTNINLNETKYALNLSNDFNINSNFDSNLKIVSGNFNNLDSSKLKNFSELDNLLKKAKVVQKDKTKWLFVIGIEKYEYTDYISYAKRSAQMFVNVGEKVLGVPKENIFALIDDGATQAKIKANMKRLIRRVQPGDTIYFYYNGHGVPVPKLGNEPFILTSDTEPDFIADESFFSLKNIYNKLSDTKADKVIAFVDSCFSGVTDGKAVLKGVAATKMVAKTVKFDEDKMVVLTAGKGHQYSNGYDKKGHRLFSYYVLKNIIEGKSDIKTLFKDTKKQTYDTSLIEYGDLRVQEPTIVGNFRLSL